MEFRDGSVEYIPYSLDEAGDICKVLYKLYTEAGVQVIRGGLQPTEAIAEGKDVVAGPFHPAFRELVEGSILADKVRETLKKPCAGIIKINEKDISKLYANKKYYFNKLLNEGYKLTVQVVNTLERGKIIIE